VWQIVVVVGFDGAPAGVARPAGLANAQRPELEDLQQDSIGLSRGSHGEFTSQEEAWQWTDSG
jgi:hypothetical protein